MEPSPSDDQKNKAIAPRDDQKRQACPACKYHRRKCTLDCYFAYYYPSDLYADYPLAQKRYGLRNLEKLTQNIQPDLREIALRTLLFESQARATYPVAGCVAVINDFSRQIQQNQVELNLVHDQLAMHRATAGYQHQLHLQQPYTHNQFQSQETNIIPVIGSEIGHASPSNWVDSTRNYVQYLWEPQEQEGRHDGPSNLFGSVQQHGQYVQELQAREGGHEGPSSSPGSVQQYGQYPQEQQAQHQGGRGSPLNSLGSLKQYDQHPQDQQKVQGCYEQNLCPFEESVNSFYLQDWTQSPLDKQSPFDESDKSRSFERYNVKDISED
ncbi:hypothetical protein REPUB_Repub14bG0065900 [Reevesia pubescens]